MNRTVLGISAVVLAVTVGAGILLFSTTREDEPATAQNDETAAPGWQGFPPEAFLYIGPYRILSTHYGGSLPSRQFDRTAFAVSKPATGLESARASSLFPQNVPDDYEVIAADSAGQPSELYLELTLSGPAGDLLVTRSRPAATPIDIRPSEDFDGSWQPLRSVGEGIFVTPPVGLEASEPALLRAFENGVDTTISGVELNPEQAAEIFNDLAFSYRETIGERLNPTLPAEDELIPSRQEVDLSGPCEVTPHLTLEYAAREIQLKLAASARCVGLLESKLCSPEEREWLGAEANSVDLACDLDDVPVKADWLASGDISQCSYGAYALLDGEDLVSGFEECSIIIKQMPDQVPIEACLTIRGQKSCAIFAYSLQ